MQFAWTKCRTCQRGLVPKQQEKAAYANSMAEGDLKRWSLKSLKDPKGLCDPRRSGTLAEANLWSMFWFLEAIFGLLREIVLLDTQFPSEAFFGCFQNSAQQNMFFDSPSASLHLEPWLCRNSKAIYCCSMDMDFRTFCGLCLVCCTDFSYIV